MHPLARFIFVVLAACVSPSAGLAETAEDFPPESLMGQHPVALEKFVQLRAGLKHAKVEELLGKRGQHQFTYKDDEGAVWQYFKYVVAKEPRYASSGYDLLYKDDSLYAIVDYMDDGDHRTEVAPKLDEIKDSVKRTERYIQEVFRLKAIRGDDLAAKMGELKKHILDKEKENKARDARNPPDPGLTVLYLLFVAPFGLEAEYDRAYKKNREYEAKFDGGKIELGMTKAQMSELFGQPLFVDKISENEQLAVYGPDSKALAAIISYLKCDPVAVLFRDGAAVRVTSNSYLDPSWRNRARAGLKALQDGKP
jgi:hypothetical protein